MNRIIFDVPKWHVFQHRSSRGLKYAEQEDGPRLRFEDELFDRLYSGEPDRLANEKKVPELREWAEKVHAACDQLPAFARLAEECRGDPDAAASATEEMVGQLKGHLDQEPGKLPPPVLRRMLGVACERASSAVEAQREAAEVFEGVLWGSGPGQPGASVSGQARGLAARLKQDARLRRIAELAGKFKRIALAKQRSKVKHGHDEIADIEQGNDLGRLLPNELLRRSRRWRRTMQLLFLRDLMERRCLQYQLTGMEPLGKGPLVVLLDKSGSMEGDRDIWATAVSLALLEIAQRQKRPFAVLAFESIVRFEALVEPGGELPDQALFVGCGGGTEIATAIRRGLHLVADHPGTLKKADLVLVTDGWSDSAGAQVLREQARDLGASILGASIGVGPELLQPWCDQVCGVDRLDSMEEKAAEQLFTV